MDSTCETFQPPVRNTDISKPTSSHALRINAAPEFNRKALVEALSERLTRNEQGVLISNGLSTELLCFPSDLSAAHVQALNKKVINALEFATGFTDVDALNAILWMAPKPEGWSAPPYHLALGLYLYFADECSRLHPETTFLSELRKGGVSLKEWEKAYPQEIEDKMMAVLDKLGMKQTHGAILEEWRKTGAYTIQGEKHAVDDKLNVMSGAYAFLARDICHLQKYLGMNMPISYALGNKKYAASMTPEETYAFTRSLSTPEPPTHIDSRIRQRVESGTLSRKRRILLEIRRQMEHLPRPNEEEQKETRALGRQAFALLPDAALEILYREGYNLAYADGINITQSYPKNGLPELSDDKNGMLQKSLGLRLNRYRQLFFANGQRETPGDLDRDPSLKQLVFAQTLSHEIMHLAVDYLSTPEREPLVQAVEKLHAALERRKKEGTLPAYFDEQLKTIDYNTLSQVLDREAVLYDGYPKKAGDRDRKWDEVICNLYGLMNTEFPYPKKTAASHPLASSHNPYRDLPELAALAEQIERDMDLALCRCRKNFRNNALPGTGMAATHA